MPYMGVTVFDGNNKIIIKMHGPLDNFVINPRELRDSATAFWDNHTSKNIPQRVQELAEILKVIYCDGEEVVWVSVEYQMPSSGNIFGASAEKVLVQNVQT